MPATAEPTVSAVTTPLPSPRTFRDRLAASPEGCRTVAESRETVRRLLRKQDDRFLVIVGPCSIHDTEAALEYAACLAPLRDRYGDRLEIVMRAYFEKPRTSIGWRGLVSDPYLDGSFNMAEGLRRARLLLLALAEQGMPTATELLDLATPAYFADLISFATIGARTTESQPHRALASSLDLPVGFKNGTDGGIEVAVNAMVSAREGHAFVAMDDDGRPCAVRSLGNAYSLLVLRGGLVSIPNYGPESVAAAETRLRAAGFDSPSLLVDASHANSGYDPDQQASACFSAVRQRRAGRRSLIGVMVESNLVHGKQKLAPAGGAGGLRHGVSVTDACLGWEGTAALLGELHTLLGKTV
ncbi:MAG: 3-deoxy-7-phosphoheptulonate synthase [Cytophagales bacterium]|nr:3-deoxy-7-phosphoheptulonate synthase [Armatimonadota bacterium]